MNFWSLPKNFGRFFNSSIFRWIVRIHFVVVQRFVGRKFKWSAIRRQQRRNSNGCSSARPKEHRPVQNRGGGIFKVLLISTNMIISLYKGINFRFCIGFETRFRRYSLCKMKEMHFRNWKFELFRNFLGKFVRAIIEKIQVLDLR